MPFNELIDAQLITKRISAILDSFFPFWPPHGAKNQPISPNIILKNFGMHSYRRLSAAKLPFSATAKKRGSHDCFRHSCAAGMLAISALASFVPALKAPRIDPVEALRHE